MMFLVNQLGILQGKFIVKSLGLSLPGLSRTFINVLLSFVFYVEGSYVERIGLMIGG